MHKLHAVVGRLFRERLGVKVSVLAKRRQLGRFIFQMSRQNLAKGVQNADKLRARVRSRRGETGIEVVFELL